AELEQTAARRSALAEALDGLSRADSDVRDRLAAARDRLGRVRTDRDDLIDRAARVQTSLEDLRVRQGDLRGRVEVLEDLERTLDGLGAGVRFVLERVNAARETPGTEYSVLSTQHSPLANVAGLVADLLTVPHEIAPAVELALGEAAQR